MKSRKQQVGLALAWEVRQANSKSVALFDQLVAKSTVNSDRKLSKFQCKSTMVADTTVNNERGQKGIAEIDISEAHGSPGAETFQSASPQIMLERLPAHGEAGE